MHFIVILSAILIIFGLMIAAKSYKTSVLRTIKGISFFILGATCLLCLRWDFFNLPRSYVVCCSEEISDEQLQHLLAPYLAFNNSFELVRFSTVKPKMRSTLHIENTENWLENIATKSIQKFSTMQTWGSRQTLILIQDHGLSWKNLPVVDIDVEKIRKTLQRQKIDLFLIHPKGLQGIGKINIHLENLEVPPVNISELADVVLVELLNGPKGFQYNSYIDVYLDSKLPGNYGFYKKNITVSKKGNYRFNLGDLQANTSNHVLQEGQHRLLVEWYVKTSTQTIKYQQACVYIQVVENAIVFIGSREKSMGELADITWQGKKHWKNLLETTLMSLQNSASYRLRLRCLRNSYFLYWQKLERLPKLLKKAKALVLLEPSPENILSLENSYKISQNIQNGLQVLVIGPPVVKNPPQWFLAMSQPINKNSSETLKMYRDLRLYIGFDNSRVCRFSNADRLNAFQVQKNFMEQMLRLLGSPEKLENYGKLTGISQQSTTQNSLAIYPTINYYHEAPWKEYYHHKFKGISGGLGFFYSTLSSNVGIRLSQICDSRITKKFATTYRPIDFSHMYPNTTILLFCIDLPQIKINREVSQIASAHARLAIGRRYISDSMGSSLEIQDLLKSQLQIHMIHLKLPKNIVKTYQPKIAELAKVLGSSTVDISKISAKNLEHHVIDLNKPSTQIIQNIANICQKIQQQINTLQKGHLHTVYTTKVFDERGRTTRPAPDVHSIFRPDPQTAPHAFIVDNRYRLPAVVRRSFGEGYVIQMAYSPLDSTIWKDDLNPEMMDGYGIQRIIDLMQLNTAQYLTQYPKLRSVTEELDGETITLQCWQKNIRDSPLFIPEIAGQLCKIKEINPNAHSVCYTFVATNKYEGFYPIRLSPETTEKIFLCLEPSKNKVEEDHTSTLAWLANISGGGVLQHKTQLECEQSSMPILSGITIAVFVTLLVCFMWYRLNFVWNWLKNKFTKKILMAPEESSLKFDNETLSYIVGESINQTPQAVKSYGVRATVRRYMAKDSASCIVKQSLVGLTDTGKKLGLPFRPKVRPKYPQRSSAVLIILENSEVLSISRAKRQAAFEMFKFVANTMSRRGDRITFITVGKHSRELEDQVSKIEFGEFDSGVDEVMSYHWEDFRIVFYIGDIIAMPRQVHRSLTSDCLEENINLRLIHVYDPQELQTAGICRDIVAGSLYERSELSEYEIRQLYLKQIKSLLQNNVALSISCDLSNDQIIDCIHETEFFHFTKGD